MQWTQFLFLKKDDFINYHSHFLMWKWFLSWPTLSISCKIFQPSRSWVGITRWILTQQSAPSQHLAQWIAQVDYRPLRPSAKWLSLALVLVASCFIPRLWQLTPLPVGPRFGAGAPQQISVSCCLVRMILAWAGGRNEENSFWSSKSKFLFILLKINLKET